jgi:Flp pilus assembly protein TadD
MAHHMRGSKPSTTPQPGRVLAAVMASLMLGACAQTGDLLPMASNSLIQTSDDSEADDKKPVVAQNELQKATTYWGMEYAKKPSELKPALNYARNLKALGENGKALAVLQQTSSLHDGDPELAGEYGRLALEMGQVNVAARMLEVADDPAKPDWKVISARGTVLAKQGQFKQAIPFYERALTVSNNQPSVLNNLAMAYAMSGEAKKAEDLLRQASAGKADGNTAKVNQNLALVLGLQGRYDEAKNVTTGTAAAGEASDNVDMLRKFVKIDPKASSMALAAGAVPDFKTKVSRAIATAEPAAFTEPGIASAAEAAKVSAAQAARVSAAEAAKISAAEAAKVSAAPLFKAAVADAPAAVNDAWNPSLASSARVAAQPVSAPASASASSGLKGSAP